jgi:hypothetical protein
MATNNQFNDFNLPVDGYTAFDALSLKSLIIKRLNSSNNYTDQRYEGSNLSSIIDIVAYAYHVLLFYLNRTSSESTFSTAELYENINKIVKLIGYNPIGKQTAILPFKASSNGNLPTGTYTIPRFSYFNVNGTVYSFNKDITFGNTTNAATALTDLQDNNLLYQGTFAEYPSYFATGAPFETITVTVVATNATNINIDHFNIVVYVKSPATGSKWQLWSPTQSLFLEKSNALKYEIRLNENGRYEIKFGNNVTGQQLIEGAEIAVYYLQSNGTKGEIGPGLLDNKSLYFYSTARFNSIKADTISPNLQLITTAQAANIVFSNTDASTKFVDVESVSSIKTNAQNTFRGQFRLIAANDFVNYIDKNYNNIIASTRVVNNWDYVSGHLKYFFDLGVTKPNIESRVLFNQVKFADSSNFNNVYIYAVPKLVKTSSATTRTNYLNSAQKQLILNDLQNVKLTTAEIIINDPVYVEVSIGVTNGSETLSPSISDSTSLIVTRDPVSRKDPTMIKQLISGIFTDYFATTKDNLGLTVSIVDITNQILAIDGVTGITTQRIINGQLYSVPGVSLLVYNPVYPYDDIAVTTQDLALPYFKFPYLKDALNFINKITVVTPSTQSLTTEY